MLTLEVMTRSSHEFRGCISTYPQTPYVSSCFGSQTEEFPRNVNETIEWSYRTSDRIPIDKENSRSQGYRKARCLRGEQHVQLESPRK